MRMNSAINFSGSIKQKSTDFVLWVASKGLIAVTFVAFITFSAVYSVFKGIIYFIVGAFILFIQIGIIAVILRYVLIWLLKMWH